MFKWWDKIEKWACNNNIELQWDENEKRKEEARQKDLKWHKEQDERMWQCEVNKMMKEKAKIFKKMEYIELNKDKIEELKNKPVGELTINEIEFLRTCDIFINVKAIKEEEEE